MVGSERVRALLGSAFEGSGGLMRRLSPETAGEGKVREWASLGDGRRLLVTTDRLSAFDRVLAAVPYKGQVLNQLSAWWFERTRDIIDSHYLSSPDPNASIVLEARPFPIEVIVRGFITGVTSTALWTRYEKGERTIYGQAFPEGLRKNQELARPVITPTTKGGPSGHDERLSPDEVVSQGHLDEATWAAVRDAAVALFERGRKLSREAGLLLVDTKYEFGRAPDGRVLVIDEMHTPDSSRFWRLSTYRERFESGLEPEILDKERVRLAYAELGYRGDGPAPAMPDSLWVETSLAYQRAYEALTGLPFAPGDYPVGPRLEASLRAEGILG
jgi:phosphoribosylaminoimidazole-succinocarboxamide synthase